MRKETFAICDRIINGVFVDNDEMSEILGHKHTGDSDYDNRIISLLKANGWNLDEDEMGTVSETGFLYPLIA